MPKHAALLLVAFIYAYMCGQVFLVPTRTPNAPFPNPPFSGLDYHVRVDDYSSGLPRWHSLLQRQGSAIGGTRIDHHLRGMLSDSIYRLTSDIHQRRTRRFEGAWSDLDFPVTARWHRLVLRTATYFRWACYHIEAFLFSPSLSRT